MDLKTYECLKDLHDRHGPREFGKICQKFLAVAFLDLGFRHVVERGVQGVDLDVAADPDCPGGERYAIEVKTTVGKSVHFGEKDVDGLKSRGRDGYRPVLAALQVAPLSRWHLARAESLKAGDYPLDSLRPYGLKELTERIEPLFAQAVAQYYPGACERGQEYLDEVLRGKGGRAEG